MLKSVDICFLINLSPIAGNNALILKFGELSLSLLLMSDGSIICCFDNLNLMNSDLVLEVISFMSLSINLIVIWICFITIFILLILSLNVEINNSSFNFCCCIGCGI